MYYPALLRNRVWIILSHFFPQKIVEIRWKIKFGYPINLKKPRDLNEKILWLSLFSDTKQWTRLSDKYKVRDYVVEKGLGHLLPSLYGIWDDVDKINFDLLPNRFVLKCNHDCGSTTIIDKNDDPDINTIKEKYKLLLKLDYGSRGEFHYSPINPHVIAEEYLINSLNNISSSIVDYKVWCFHGAPYCVMTIHDRMENNAKIGLYDLDWQSIPNSLIYSNHYLNGQNMIPKPSSLNEMLNAAVVLSNGFPEVRIDFYDVNGKLYFGEMTFTSLAGRMNYFTPNFLVEMGNQVRIS